METGRKKRRRLRTALLAAALVLALAVGILQLGTVYNARAQIHWTPDYPRVDILPLLEKPFRTEEDYAVLYAQTGLTRLGVEDLLAAGDIPRVLEIQDNYFRDYTVETEKFAPFTCTQTIDGAAAFAPLANGDIIVSSTAFFSWFRCGHAAMVVDGEEQLLVNAISLGSTSSLDPASGYEHRANFMVLRPKLPSELLEKVVAYAREYLVELPYRLTAGILTAKDQEPLTGTQCAHLVWYAFQKFGVDLDGDGGMLVTPKDLAASGCLELVQTFGFDPWKLWA